VSNAVKVQDEQVPTVPESRNVFECAGDAMTQGNVIIGDLLKFSKGDWLAGPDGEEIAAGTELVAIVPGTVHGWMRWEAAIWGRKRISRKWVVQDQEGGGAEGARR
jgi:hypothetical protein